LSAIHAEREQATGAVIDMHAMHEGQVSLREVLVPCAPHSNNA